MSGLLVAGGISAAIVSVQAAEAPSFPVGSWEGQVFLTGWYSSDTERSDGSFDVSNIDVIGDTAITFDVEVEEDGSIAGSMNVRIVTFGESAGIKPTTFDPYHVEMFRDQTGELTVTGTATRLVATGTLTTDTVVEADGRIVPQVTSSESGGVEWVFEVDLANCAIVQAPLVSATGESIMRTALLDRDISTNSGDIHNRLLAGILAITSHIDPIDISDERNAVDSAAAALASQDNPAAVTMVELIEAWRALANILAALDECELEELDQSESFQDTWLAEQLRLAVQKANFAHEAYSAGELMDIHDAAAEGGGLDETGAQFLRTHVGERVATLAAAEDYSTLLDIVVWSAAWGYSDLHAAARDALGDQAP